MFIFFFLEFQRVTDADLRALVSDEVFQPELVWKLLDMQVNLDTVFDFAHDLIFIILKGENLQQLT